MFPTRSVNYLTIIDMDGPFIYDKYVTGKNFIGRKEDCKSLSIMLSQGEHVAIYEPPKTGKTSLIQQTLLNMNIAGARFTAREFSVLNIRSVETFILRYGAAAMRTSASTPGEFQDIVQRHLDGTNLAFNPEAYSSRDEVLSRIAPLDENDLKRVIELPHILARENGADIYMIIDEFQNIEDTDNGDLIMKYLLETIKEYSDIRTPGCTYIFSGSRLNAMKDIFEHRRVFYNKVKHLSLSQASERDVIDHIIRGFLSGGKVIDKDLLTGMCKIFKCNLWYINHFAAISNSLSKGYVIESTLNEALRSVIAIHEPRFVATVNDLTTFQTSLLRAILEGNVKLSTSEVISKYNLNSSANVKRLKDALTKKELVTFDEKDEPKVIDPLFEHWVRKYYFEIDPK